MDARSTHAHRLACAAPKPRAIRRKTVAHPGDPLLAAHLLAAVGNGACLEMPMHSLAALEPVAQVGHRLRDGRLELDSAPGWGIRMDAQAAQRCAVD